MARILFTRDAYNYKRVPFSGGGLSSVIFPFPVGFAAWQGGHD
jgi:hypothetical protein